MEPHPLEKGRKRPALVGPQSVRCNDEELVAEFMES
jgi:hypothetical protein